MEHFCVGFPLISRGSFTAAFHICMKVQTNCPWPLCRRFTMPIYQVPPRARSLLLPMTTPGSRCSPELWAIVAQYLPDLDVAALAVICRSAHNGTLPALWRYLHVSHIQEPEEPQTCGCYPSLAHSITRLTGLLATTPGRSVYVRSLAIKIDVLCELSFMQGAVLLQLSNVVELSVFDDVNALDNPTFFDMQRLVASPVMSILSNPPFSDVLRLNFRHVAMLNLDVVVTRWTVLQQLTLEGVHLHLSQPSTAHSAFHLMKLTPSLSMGDQYFSDFLSASSITELYIRPLPESEEHEADALGRVWSSLSSRLQILDIGPWIHYRPSSGEWCPSAGETAYIFLLIIPKPAQRDFKFTSPVSPSWNTSRRHSTRVACPPAHLPCGWPGLFEDFRTILSNRSLWF